MRQYLLTMSRPNLVRPSLPLETRDPRASSIGKPVLLTALVVELVVERRERLAVNSWGDSGIAHLFARLLKRPSGAPP